MKLIKLSLENFRQYDKAELDFTSGITSVVGPNGAGKTTLLEAVAWCFYGINAVRGKNDDLPRLGNKNNKVKAVLNFALGNDDYQIERTQNNSTLSKIINGEIITFAAGVSETTKKIEELLNMTLQQFSTSFYAKQKELEFMSYNSNKRQEEISKMLGYEPVGKAIELAKARNKELGNVIKGMEAGMGDIDQLTAEKKERETARDEAKTKLAAHQALLNEAQSKLNEYVEVKKQAEQVERAYHLKKDRIEGVERLIRNERQQEENLKHKKAQVDGAKEKLKTLPFDMEAYQKIKKDIAEQETLQKHETTKGIYQTNIANNNKRIVELKLELERFGNIESLLTKSENEKQTLEKRFAELEAEYTKVRDDWNRNKSTKEAEITQLNATLNRQKTHLEKLKKLGAGGKCPTCEQALGESFERTVKRHEDEIADFEKQLSTAKEELAKIEVEPEALKSLMEQVHETKKKIDKVREECTRIKANSERAQRIASDVARLEKETAQIAEQLMQLPKGFDIEKLELLRKSFAEMDRIKLERTTLEAQISAGEGIENQLNSIQESLKLHQTELDQLKSDLVELNFNQENYESVLTEFKRRESAVESAKEQWQAANSHVLVIEKDLQNAKKSIDEYRSKRAELDELRQKFLITEEAQKALTQFRASLNNQIGPELSHHASDFLSRLSEGRYSELEVTEKFEFNLKDNGEIVSVPSGGETDIINLSLRLALAKMITTRAGQPLSLLVLDEVFGSLDTKRRQSLMSVLDTLRDWFDQIIIISHIEEINEAADQTIQVHYDSDRHVSAFISKIELDPEDFSMVNLEN